MMTDLLFEHAATNDHIGMVRWSVVCLGVLQFNPRVCSNLGHHRPDGAAADSWNSFLVVNTPSGVQ